MSVALLTSIEEIGQDVARAMVRVSTRDGAARISTPVLFPSGSCIGVEISRHKDGFLVSDMGGAAVEADMLGGARQFARIARDVAERFGVRFDKHMIFDLAVPQEELTVAVIAVSNAAKSAVETTMQQIAAREPVDMRALLWTRLETVFSGARVLRNAKLRGSSEEWTFDAVLQIGDRQTLFEVVTPHANAVSSAVTKFLDIRDLGNAAPRRVAVLPDREKTPHLTVLARTARIIPQGASAETWRDAA